MNEKEILINAIREYNDIVPIYLTRNNKLNRFSTQTIMQILNNENSRRRFLIENKYGILGSLLDKFKNQLDDDILFEIYLKDLTLDPGTIVYINDEKMLYKICSIEKMIPKLFGHVVDKKYFSLEIIKDKETIKKILANDPNHYEYVNSIFKRDKDLIKELISVNSRYFKYVDESLKCDRKFVKDVIFINGNIIEYIDESLKNDKSLLSDIIKEKTFLFKYVGDKLKQDKNFVLEILKNDKYIYEYIQDELKNDKDILVLIR